MPEPEIHLQPEDHPAHKVQLRTSQDIADAVPYLLGWHPQESLVVLLVDHQGRIPVKARADLHDALNDPAQLWATIARFPAATHLLVIYTETDTDLTPIIDTHGALRARMSRSAALLVQAGRVHTAHEPGPGPGGFGEGLPLRTNDQNAAAFVASGVAPLRSRAELSATFQGPPLPAPVMFRAAARPASRHTWRSVLTALSRDPRSLPGPQQSAELLMSLAIDVHLRDRVLTSFAAGDVPLELILHLSRQASGPHVRARTYAVVAMSAFLNGSGALARIAAEKALTLGTDQPLALLVRQALMYGLHPDTLRAELQTGHGL